MDQEESNIGFNLRCEQLKQKLINEINQSNLPIAIVFYMIENIYREAEKSYYATLNDESQTNAVQKEVVAGEMKEEN